jgi:hypothetical protein
MLNLGINDVEAHRESDQTNPTRQPSEQGSSRATEQAVEQDQRVRRDGVEPPSTDLNELRPDIEDARTKPSTEQRGSDTVATSTRSDGQDELDLGRLRSLKIAGATTPEELSSEYVIASMFNREVA